MVAIPGPYEMRFSIESSIGVPLFRTDLEKVVRPGARRPAEDDITAVSPNLQRRLSKGYQRPRVVDDSRRVCTVLDGSQKQLF